jgi:pectate lyase
MKYPALPVLLAVLCLDLVPSIRGAGEATFLPAFPGAEGAGADTPGGRGGHILFVTNLDDDGPGSLRAACEQSGPRTVMFRVSGTIRLKSPLTIQQPYITIAGQTAPGDGICLRDQPLIVTANHVVLRHLRSRLGDESGRQTDCITFFGGASHVIVDHCSTSWSIDECLSLSGDIGHVTVQWCLIGEPLRASKHVKGPHGYGSLSRATGPVTWHHNLWLHADARNPRLGDYYGRGIPTFDVRNNVIYDYGATATGLTQGHLRANYVANYLRSGPSSKARTPITVGPDSDLQFFIRDNVFEDHTDFTADNAKFFSAMEIDGRRQVRLFAEPFPVAPVTVTDAAEALAAVLAQAGAILPRRDAVDARLVEHVRTRGGHIIDSQRDVGGWPELRSAPAPADSDEDGMPDAWETAHNLNPHDAADAWQDADGDGYTNLEEFLTATNPREFVDYRRPAL